MPNRKALFEFLLLGLFELKIRDSNISPLSRLLGTAMKKLISGLLYIGLALSCVTAQAHHSFSATFTDQRDTTIEGVVTQFSFRNPHILVYIDVTNDDGSVTGWITEGGSATGFRRQGWSTDTIQPGQLVRVTGDATHDGSPMTSFGSLAFLDPDTRAVVSTLGEGGQGGRGENAYQPEIDENFALTLADGKPNLSSVWSNQGIRTTRPGQFAEDAPLNDAGLALQADFDISTDAQVFCDPVGLIRQIVTPHPAKIEQFDDHVLLTYEEFGGYRKIYFDDRNAKGINTHYGDSIAHYEGDKLVIETTNLLANQATNRGFRLTDQVTVVETYSRADDDEGSILMLNMIVSDPAHLAKDIEHNMLYRDQGAYQFIENDCQSPLRERVEVHPAMNFFLTSAGPGDGANLGGLEGADAHCAALATSVGQGDKNWTAYLSTTGANGVNARDRIADAAPFYNAKGVPVAVDVADLHSDSNMITKPTVVTERGAVVNGRGDTPNRHDILTGSDMNGMAVNSGTDTSCSNWTSNGEGSALVGHFDREGGGDNPTSWNSAHASRGCGQADLQGTGGDGLFYCFATP